MDDRRTAELLAGILDDRTPCPAVEDFLPPADGGFSISPELGRLLARVVQRFERRNILEFGAGRSSLILAHALASAGGGRLTSIEQRPEWCAEAWAGVGQVPGVSARLLIAAPRLRVSPAGVYYAYRDAGPAVASGGPYDLVLIDAPQWYYGRDGSLHLAWPHLAAGALVILDDAGRRGERWTVIRWQRTYPGLSLIAADLEFGGRGVAVLRQGDLRRRRFSMVSLVSSAYHARRNARARRRHRLKA